MEGEAFLLSTAQQWNGVASAWTRWLVVLEHEEGELTKTKGWRAAWLAWAMEGGDQTSADELPWAVDIPRRERPAGEAPWWALAIADRKTWRNDVAWLRWACGELDAFTVAATTTGEALITSAPSWAIDLLWSRWLRGEATAADVAAALGLDAGTDPLAEAPAWVRVAATSDS